MKRLLVILFSLLLFAMSANYLLSHIEYSYHEPNIKALLETKLQKGELDKRILQALKQNRYDEAQGYIRLAKTFNIDLNETTKQAFAKQSTTTKKLVRGAKNFIGGFFSGKGESGTAIAGAVTSDFTLYGDLRDIYREGSHYLANESYDRFILAISMVGVALSATTVITLGSSGALKGAASVLKLAKREKYLTKGFSRVLEQRLAKSVDTKALKSIHFRSIDEIKKSSRVIAKSVHLKPLKPLLKDIHTIQKNSSVADSLKLLKYVDNTKELKAVAKLTKRYKGATVGIFKLLGKRAIRLVKGSIKWSSKLLFAALSALFSVFAFLFGIFYNIFLIKKIFAK